MKNTTNATPITKQVIDGQSFYTAVRRGTEYCAYFSDVVGAWFVSSKRIALGHSIGGGKYYSDIGDCKAFAALPALLRMGAM